MVDEYFKLKFRNNSELQLKLSHNRRCGDTREIRGRKIGQRTNGVAECRNPAATIMRKEIRRHRLLLHPSPPPRTIFFHRFPLFHASRYTRVVSARYTRKMENGITRFVHLKLQKEFVNKFLWKIGPYNFQSEYNICFKCWNWKRQRASKNPKWEIFVLFNFKINILCMHKKRNRNMFSAGYKLSVRFWRKKTSVESAAEKADFYSLVSVILDALSYISPENRMYKKFIQIIHLLISSN